MPNTATLNAQLALEAASRSHGGEESALVLEVAEKYLKWLDSHAAAQAQKTVSKDAFPDVILPEIKSRSVSGMIAINPQPHP